MTGCVGFEDVEVTIMSTHSPGSTHFTWTQDGNVIVRDNEMVARSSLTSFLAGHAPGRSRRNKRKSGGTQQKSGSAAPDEKKKKARTVDTSQPPQVKGNKKRTAKSLAEDGRRQLTLDQIMLVPARRAKRKKVEASEICGGCKSS